MIYQGKVTKVTIYNNTRNLTMAQVKAQMGCDIIINGGYFAGSGGNGDGGCGLVRRDDAGYPSVSPRDDIFVRRKKFWKGAHPNPKGSPAKRVFLGTRRNP